MLEVGFGHGRTIQRVAAMASEGCVAGIDTSDEMLRMASRQCRPLIESGRVRLDVADSAVIPHADNHFDKAYGIHTLYFWPDPTVHLRELHRVLRIGGRLVLGFRSKDSGAAGEFPESVYTFHHTDDVRSMFDACRFTDVHISFPSSEVTFIVATA